MLVTKSINQLLSIEVTFVTLLLQVRVDALVSDAAAKGSCFVEMSFFVNH